MVLGRAVSFTRSASSSGHSCVVVAPPRLQSSALSAHARADRVQQHPQRPCKATPRTPPVTRRGRARRVLAEGEAGAYANGTATTGTRIEPPRRYTSDFQFDGDDAEETRAPHEQALVEKLTAGAMHENGELDDHELLARCGYELRTDEEQDMILRFALP